jgi:hypothetical protein
MPENGVTEEGVEEDQRGRMECRKLLKEGRLISTRGKEGLQISRWE